MAELLIRATEACRDTKGRFIMGHTCLVKPKPITKLLERVCLICGEKFLRWECHIREHGDKYCSRKCSGIAKRGKSAWNKGKGIIKICIDCNKILASKYATRCRQCDTKNKLGDKSHLWKGGVSKLPYSFDFNSELKELIRKRDGYKCKLCGVSQIDCIEKLCTHHIDYDKYNSNPTNLISLCASCHSKTNHNQKYWKNKFLTLEVNRG